MSQFRIRYTNIIYGDVVHISCSSCFPHNTKHTPQRCLMVRNLQSLSLSAGLSASPHSDLLIQEDDLPYLSPVTPAFVCESTATPPLPQVTSVHYVETTCVPRAWSKRWKMIWKRHSWNWANRNEVCFQEGWTAMGRVNIARGAFRNEGCYNTITASKSPE